MAKSWQVEDQGFLIELRDLTLDENQTEQVMSEGSEIVEIQGKE